MVHVATGGGERLDQNIHRGPLCNVPMSSFEQLGHYAGIDIADLCIDFGIASDPEETDSDSCDRCNVGRWGGGLPQYFERLNFTFDHL